MKRTCLAVATLFMAPLAALHAADAPQPAAKPNTALILSGDVG